MASIYGQTIHEHDDPKVREDFERLNSRNANTVERVEKIENVIPELARKEDIPKVETKQLDVYENDDIVLKDTRELNFVDDGNVKFTGTQDSSMRANISANVDLDALEIPVVRPFIPLKSDCRDYFNAIKVMTPIITENLTANVYVPIKWNSNIIVGHSRIGTQYLRAAKDGFYQVNVYFRLDCADDTTNARPNLTAPTPTNLDLTNYFFWLTHSRSKLGLFKNDVLYNELDTASLMSAWNSDLSLQGYRFSLQGSTLIHLEKGDTIHTAFKQMILSTTPVVAESYLATILATSFFGFYGYFDFIYLGSEEQDVIVPSLPTI
jgi:hypothetical protein